MKRIILLTVTFFFIYPIFLDFIPIPLDRIYQILGFVLLVIRSKDINRMFKSKYIKRYLAITAFLLLLTLIPQLWAVQSTDFWFVKEVVNVFLQIFSAYFVYRTAIWALGKVNVGTAIYYIVLAAILQVVISAIFFINPEYYHYYASFLNQDIRIKDPEEIQYLLNIRFMGIGSEVFGGVVKYGISFFSVLILPYVHKNFLTKRKSLYWITVLAIFTGGLLTGRTFFIAILFGFLMYAIYRSSSLFSFIIENIKLIIFILILFVVFIQITSILIDEQQFQYVYNFVFEMFINLSSGDGLESRSTNHLMEMYIFPESIKTWLFGDGRMTGIDFVYYMGTDVGYIRLLFYFGLPATLYFIYVLLRYCMLLYKSYPIKIMKYFYSTVFLFLIVLNFKGLIFPTYYFALFFIFTVLAKESVGVNTK